MKTATGNIATPCQITQLLPHRIQLRKTRALSYKRVADMLHMVFNFLYFFFTGFFNPT